MFGILRGEQPFNVARARGLARELIALEDEHAVFTDWTMERGKGPDNREPGAFGGCGHCRGSGTEPKGPLSGHCEPPDCYACDGLGDEKPGGWPGKLAREWPGDPRAPQGRSLARVGRRLLEALEGQSDECQACGDDCDVVVDTETLQDVCDCDSCHGTGHNLAGYLPEVEWSSQLRRRIREGYVYRSSDRGRCWLDTLDVHPGYGVTRVVPRGEHHEGRHLRTMIAVRDELAWVQASNLPGLGGQHDAHVLAYQRQRFPRWRRGGLLHAQQRRQRDWDRIQSVYYSAEAAQ